MRSPTLSLGRGKLDRSDAITKSISIHTLIDFHPLVAISVVQLICLIIGNTKLPEDSLANSAKECGMTIALWQLDVDVRLNVTDARVMNLKRAKYRPQGWSLRNRTKLKAYAGGSAKIKVRAKIENVEGVLRCAEAVGCHGFEEPNEDEVMSCMGVNSCRMIIGAPALSPR
jgi:hypothetical protein